MAGSRDRVYVMAPARAGWRTGTGIARGAKGTRRMTGKRILMVSMGAGGNGVASAFLDTLLAQCGAGPNGQPPALTQNASTPQQRQAARPAS